jgi:hypothetical protein
MTLDEPQDQQYDQDNGVHLARTEAAVVAPSPHGWLLPPTGVDFQSFKPGGGFVCARSDGSGVSEA